VGKNEQRKNKLKIADDSKTPSEIYSIILRGVICTLKTMFQSYYVSENIEALMKYINEKKIISAEEYKRLLYEARDFYPVIICALFLNPIKKHTKNFKVIEISAEAKKLLAERAATERVRYKDIYNLNYMDFNNYDLVIDSTYCATEKIAEIILKEAREHESGASKSTKMLVSPRRLLKPSEITEGDYKTLAPLVKEYEKLPDTIPVTVKVSKEEEDYTIVEGMEHAKAAFLAQTPYVPIEVVK
jgi:cytidylate kinase